ncbi:sensor histidine kinase N-terminal domain-containing protein [Aquamicrobium sp. NLF2-7]|uniref:ATP-binding protein n=1 Tax=Aquamicrobium sp. NLF2-7 TaxID=2918753 RepID=UPI001EFB3245|nr:ATP-binding protein [Aquamicrobium sp. NLF2-7]MCG8271416.1 sensor histidine kinase N-terminal domain-containing protein [Aquamicrobium sp. NLF2-7]
MRSMRTRLFGILILITGLVWLSAVAWIFFSTGAQLERVLDARLMEAARMVNSMVTKRALGAGENVGIPSVEMETHEAYNRQLSCQIWSLEGTLLSQSEGAPETRLSEHAEGFSNTVINGETWRVYTVDNPQAGVRVMVGDRVYFRDHLVNSVIFGVLLPALLILPVLAGLIWLSVGRGLTPLSRIARELSMRPASDLHPIDAGGAASELQPVVKALNALFRRVSDARERERDFIAFAAHELRTPMSGLKTQAQVALASSDPAVQQNALSQIVVGVDRTGRLVRQLLDIASLEAGGEAVAAETFNAGRVVQSVADELVTQHAGGDAVIFVDPGLSAFSFTLPAELFRLAVRNLLENAVHHSPPGGRVFCRIAEEGEDIVLRIEDEGPGIPQEELPRVTERFFRGRFRSSVGSGLGLSIVETALDHAGARLDIRNRQQGGLSAAIVIPADMAQKMKAAA